MADGAEVIESPEEDGQSQPAITGEGAFEVVNLRFGRL